MTLTLNFDFDEGMLTFISSHEIPELDDASLDFSSAIIRYKDGDNLSPMLVDWLNANSVELNSALKLSDIQKVTVKELDYLKILDLPDDKYIVVNEGLQVYIVHFNPFALELVNENFIDFETDYLKNPDFLIDKYY
jgi:hypothetical protein